MSDELRRYAVVKYVYALDADEAKRKASRRKVDEVRICDDGEGVSTEVIGFEIPPAEEPWEDPEQGRRRRRRA